jgi:hypothetical protein
MQGRQGNGTLGVPGIYRSGCMRRFGGPHKEMRSISRADKLWVEAGVGMFRPKVCA